MSDPTRASQYFRKKLEQHELTIEEWSAVRYAVIKHTLIGAVASVLSLLCHPRQQDTNTDFA